MCIIYYVYALDFTIKGHARKLVQQHADQILLLLSMCHSAMACAPSPRQA